ncbi:cation/H(+) antiporter 24-like, partial [Pistacia vera]|uniref:cation/H(+) antiporter 24-like n=1 Tax=Pistacia vera TaxID=55513 RepID=UPI001262D961
ILRPLKQPKTVCNLLSGIILGPSVLGRTKKPWDNFFPTEEMIMINATSLIGSSYITGALMMGSIIPAGPPLGSALVEKSEFIISDIFLPFFHIRMGQNVNISTITNWQQFFVLESILVTAYLSKILASMLAFIVFKKSLRDSLLFGFILNFKGMPDYVLIGGWRMRLLVDDEVLTTLMLSHMIVTAISAPIIHIFYKPERRLMSTGSSIEQRMMKPLQGMPLEVELRILFCINNEDNVNSLITLFKAWTPTEISPICAYAVHLMELIGRAVPLLVPYNNHSQQDDTKTAIFRNLNIKIQAYAPCTVGIFVDRGLPHHLSSRRFSYNVVVFFLGGPDDREAMAFVSRMSSQPGFVITVFLIDFKGDYLVGNELETDLDNTAVKEFRTRTINNSSVGFHEIEAYDSVQVMKAIISIEDKYDLVTVGKRRVANSILEKEMVPWVEQKELGILGDLIASSDFYRGMTSILVIQSAVTVRGSLKSTVITSSEISSGFSTSTGDDSYHGRTFGRASERVLEIICTKI